MYFNYNYDYDFSFYNVIMILDVMMYNDKKNAMPQGSQASD